MIGLCPPRYVLMQPQTSFAIKGSVCGIGTKNLYPGSDKLREKLQFYTLKFIIIQYVKHCFVSKIIFNFFN